MLSGLFGKCNTIYEEVSLNFKWKTALVECDIF